ncbi:STAS domain-containing protein [Bacteroidota bacterium]
MLQIAKKEGNYIISFKEEVDRFNLFISDDVKDILSKFISQPGNQLILDMEGIKFIDSTGFAVLISIINSANENNCDIEFQNIDPEVMELFEVVRLKEKFKIFDN